MATRTSLIPSNREIEHICTYSSHEGEIEIIAEGAEYRLVTRGFAAKGSKKDNIDVGFEYYQIALKCDDPHSKRVVSLPLMKSPESDEPEIVAEVSLDQILPEIENIADIRLPLEDAYIHLRDFVSSCMLQTGLFLDGGQRFYSDGWKALDNPWE